MALKKCPRCNGTIMYHECINCGYEDNIDRDKAESEKLLKDRTEHFNKPNAIRRRAKRLV